MDHLSTYFPWCLLSDEVLVRGGRFPALPSTLSLLCHTCFPEAHENTNHKQSVTSRLSFVLVLWATFPSSQRHGESFAYPRPPWQGLMVIIPRHAQTASNLSLSYLHQYCIGTECHLGSGTLYSPTAIVQMTAWGQISGKSFILCSMTLQLTWFSQRLSRK